MIPNIPVNLIAAVFSKALREGYIRKEDSAVIFYDLDYLSGRIRHIQSVFPADTLHSIAIKACPLIRIMERMHDMDCGVEAASIGEVQLALMTGYSPSRIVYDSPVKTHEEIEFALQNGIHINLDNLSELHRVQSILKDRPQHGTIGLRINPQVGLGTILESSVAGEYSKFGVPVSYKKEAILQAFLDHYWLTGMHLHVGSQGCSLDLLTEGAGVVYDLMLEVNDRRATRGMKPVEFFDIGGGLPVSYMSDNEPVSMGEYVKRLRERTPGLFSPSPGPSSKGLKLITEFGRWIFVNSGWTISRVEYVKRDPGINTAMIHVGADLFVRECLNPSDWQHEYTVLDPSGQIRAGMAEHPWNLAGPLCFSGDILAKDVMLPEIQEGDYLVIHDTGGYTYSMWSRYNSRFAPRILGYEGQQFTVLKERETEKEIWSFWK
jgi:diaminopimelate decarboxylase